MTALDMAELLDAYRVIPRLWLAGYAVMLWRVSDWFMALADPSTQQAALVSTVWGAGAMITAFYVQTGRKWS